MFYSIIVLLLFAFVVLLTRYTSKRTFIISTMVLALSVSIFYMSIYIAKCGNFPYPNSKWLILDYRMYSMLLKLKLSFYEIVRMQNIGYGVFLICIPFLGVSSKRYKDITKFYWLSLIVPILWIFVNEPVVKMRINQLLYSQSYDDIQSYKSTIGILFNALDISIIVYMFIPVFHILRKNKNVKMRVKRQQLVSHIVSICLLNVLCIVLFLWNPITRTPDRLSVESLLGFPSMTLFVTNIYYWMPAFALIIANLVLFILIKFNNMGDMDIFSKYYIVRQSVKSNKNIKAIFHSFKNVMFTINIIAKQLESEENPDKFRLLTQRLTALSEEYMEQMSSVLKVYKKEPMSVFGNDVSKCMDRVLKRMNFDSRINVTTQYDYDLYAMCDEYALDEVFINILKNSEEAIRFAKRDKGIININIYREYDWIITSITDNGIGIEKNKIKKIFNAFYTTKGTNNNWGVGLNVALKNIKRMKGTIEIQSEQNVGTTVNVILHQANKEF